MVLCETANLRGIFAATVRVEKPTSRLASRRRRARFRSIRVRMFFAMTMHLLSNSDYKTSLLRQVAANKIVVHVCGQMFMPVKDGNRNESTQRSTLRNSPPSHRDTEEEERYPRPEGPRVLSGRCRRQQVALCASKRRIPRLYSRSWVRL